jgi:hypothetical protein
MKPSETEEPSAATNAASEFEQLGDEEQLSLVAEFILFIKENKAWWMIPILVTLGAIGLLAVLGSTGAAPFIYTLF